MSVLDRFRRNRQQSVLPDEVREYYQTEQRQRRGVAVGLAIAALLVTILISAALFFGGRFVYDQIRGDDTSDNQEGAADDSSNADSEQGKESDNSNAADQQQNQDGTQGAVNAPTSPAPQPPAPVPAPVPAPTPSPSTPNLGDETLPHTGDEGM